MGGAPLDRPVDRIDEDRSLTTRAREGDAEAREELLAHVHRLAHRYARARLGTYPAASELSADVAQEVCMAVLTALPAYDERGVPFEAFVYRIAAHKVADAQRAQARGPVTADVQGPAWPQGRVSSAEDDVVAADEASRLRDVLSTLSQKHQEVLILRVAVGLTARETADVLGSTPGAVRVLQHRALAALRDRWEVQ
ncbi:sigma-70 family RNA polymerase sigma factor [Ornithinimicrobium sp. W1665]|uniref:sigma-70 family RNA polymerase sigma factor n=1 Tax=Ornithinimicrobium sp. W1665 TaxID=3416666 RepID=UPI003CEDF607